MVCDYVSLSLLDIKNTGKIEFRCLASRWPFAWEMAVHLAVAGDVFGSVFFCAVLFHTRCLG